MKSIRRKALVITFDNSKLFESRNTRHDVKNLTETFTQLNFSVVVIQNPKYAELKVALDNLSRTQVSFSKEDCIACVILSTVNSGEDFILTSDNKRFELDMVYRPFTKTDFFSRQMPKLFFIETTRNREFFSEEENVNYIKKKSSPFIMFNIFKFYSLVYDAVNDKKDSSLDSMIFKPTLNVIAELCDTLKEINSKKDSFKASMTRLVHKLNENNKSHHGQVNYFVTKFDHLRTDISLE